MENLTIMKIEEAKNQSKSPKQRQKEAKENGNGKSKKEKEKMRNITINIPENYDYNIQKLIKMKLLPSRSEAIRTAIREYLNKEYNKNLELFEFFTFNKMEEDN